MKRKLKSISAVISALAILFLMNTSCKKEEAITEETKSKTTKTTVTRTTTTTTTVVDCPDGYTGTNCTKQVTPLKIRISKIELTKFPQYDYGSSWDVTSGPDIYLKLVKDGYLIHQTDYDKNAASSYDYVFYPKSDINITDPTDEYIIRLYDFDSGSEDDYMAGIKFYPYKSKNKFPRIIKLETDRMAVELTVSYIW